MLTPPFRRIAALTAVALFVSPVAVAVSPRDPVENARAITRRVAPFGPVCARLIWPGRADTRRFPWNQRETPSSSRARCSKNTAATQPDPSSPKP